MDIRQTLDLLEAKNQHKIEQAKLPYSKSGLSPVMSSATIDNHYGKLYKGYVDRYNNNEGDRNFNEAGAYLHELFFTQFKNPSGSNRPTGRVLDLINRHWDNFVDFKQAVKVEAMKIHWLGVAHGVEGFFGTGEVAVGGYTAAAWLAEVNVTGQLADDQDVQTRNQLGLEAGRAYQLLVANGRAEVGEQAHVFAQDGSYTRQ
jgi:hypothetical protein